MGPARIYPWRKMHRSRAPSIAPGTFFVTQPWADCITNIAGFNLRQAQVYRPPGCERRTLPNSTTRADENGQGVLHLASRDGIIQHPRSANSGAARCANTE